MGFIIVSGTDVPYDYYTGGSYIQCGEKFPKCSAIKSDAKIYKSEAMAERSLNKMYDTYLGDYYFQIEEIKEKK